MSIECLHEQVNYNLFITSDIVKGVVVIQTKTNCLECGSTIKYLKERFKIDGDYTCRKFQEFASKVKENKINELHQIGNFSQIDIEDYTHRDIQACKSVFEILRKQEKRRKKEKECQQKVGSK